MSLLTLCILPLLMAAIVSGLGTLMRAPETRAHAPDLDSGREEILAWLKQGRSS